MDALAMNKTTFVRFFMTDFNFIAISYNCSMMQRNRTVWLAFTYQKC